MDNQVKEIWVSKSRTMRFLTDYKNLWMDVYAPEDPNANYSLSINVFLDEEETQQLIDALKEVRKENG